MFSIEDFKGILECVAIIKDRQKIIKKKFKVTSDHFKL